MSDEVCASFLLKADNTLLNSQKWEVKAMLNKEAVVTLSGMMALPWPWPT